MPGTLPRQTGSNRRFPIQRLTCAGDLGFIGLDSGLAPVVVPKQALRRQQIGHGRADEHQSSLRRTRAIAWRAIR